MFTNHCCHNCNCNKKHNCLEVIFGVAGAVLTIASLIFTIMFLTEKKRRKEDRELEDYLEHSIQ